MWSFVCSTMLLLAEVQRKWWQFEANLENCGPTPSNNFDLKVGQRSRSWNGANWKGLSQGSCMANISALSLIHQKIWASFKFLWWTDRQREGQTNEFYCPPLSPKAGDNYGIHVLFFQNNSWPHTVSAGPGFLDPIGEVTDKVKEEISLRYTYHCKNDSTISLNYY